VLNTKRQGQTATFTGQAKNAGEGVLLATGFVGIVANTVASGDTGTALLGGVYEVKKTSAQTWTKHVKIYWDDTAKEFTTTSSSNHYSGRADADAANPSSVGLLNVGVGFP
jgi:predicted RecA/RadA family phage recombinase